MASHSPMLTIAGREIRSSFVTPLFYALSSGFVLLSGFFFFSVLNEYNMVLQRAAMLRDVSTSLNDQVVQPFYKILEVVLIFLIPILTMRTFAEERRHGTHELLMTSPVSLGEIVVGKFLGLIFMLTLTLILSFVFPLTLILFSDPEVLPILIGFLGLVLFAASYAALGMAVSASTSNQVVAGILSLVILFLLHVIDAPAEDIGVFFSELLRFLSPAGHLDSLLKGVVQSSDIAYFLSLSLLGLFISVRILEAERWR